MISATFKHIVSSFLMLVEILGLKFPFLFGAKYLTTGLVCYLQLLQAPHTSRIKILRKRKHGNCTDI